MPMEKCRRPSRASCVPAENLAQAADLGLGLADEEDLLAAAGLVQLVADLVDDAR